MRSLEIRPTTEADLPAITEIYEHAVRYGTATFELIPPDLAEMTRRFGALMDGGFPYFVGCRRRPRGRLRLCGRRTGRGRPIASPWRIRSIFSPRSIAAASACNCCSG